MLESTQLLAPFLRRTDDLRLKEDSLAKAISLAQSGLAAATTDQVEITQWRDSFKSLSEARNAHQSLNKKKERSMDFLPLADRYLFAIQAALKRSPTPSPSRLQSLHSSADRTAAAIKALLALDRQTSGPDNRVGSLAQEWSTTLSWQRLDILRRTLHVLLIYREQLAVQSLLGQASPIGNSTELLAILGRTRDHLNQTAQSWGPLASLLPAPRYGPRAAWGALFAALMPTSVGQTKG